MSLESTVVRNLKLDSLTLARTKWIRAITSPTLVFVLSGKSKTRHLLAS